MEARLPTVDEQLELDRWLLGFSCEERTTDGERRRVDPTTLRLRAAGRHVGEGFTAPTLADWLRAFEGVRLQRTGWELVRATPLVALPRRPFAAPGALLGSTS